MIIIILNLFNKRSGKMPKVIENASEHIIKAGKDILAEKGFDDFNM